MNIYENGAPEKYYRNKERIAAITESLFERIEGMLDILSDGSGFLRVDRYSISDKDVYISETLINRFKIRQSDMVSGLMRPPEKHEIYNVIVKLEAVNNDDPENSRKRPFFKQLTPIHPVEQFKLETNSYRYSTRIMDLLIPVGKGQRGLIVSPQKAGKTVLLKEIAEGISKNHPETELIILLIEARPEEVTDMQRCVNADVVSTTFEEKPENHIKVAEMVWKRALRLVEYGKDVVVLMDSITRLTRAYNMVIPASGRSFPEDVDPGAFYNPKRFFSAASKLEEGGSLTIIAIAMVESISRINDFIYEEFKGTANMELHLDRNLSERRIFPAIDMLLSGTHREELFIDEKNLELMWALRRAFSSTKKGEFLDIVLSILKRSKTNEEFLEEMFNL